jgi:hypothetical protein
VDPQSFTVILQSGAAGGTIDCCGFAQLAAAQPTRVLVVGDAPTAQWRTHLVDALRAELKSATSIGAEACTGPGGLGCWATDAPAVRNLLVVLAGPTSPSTELSELAHEWRARDFETLGVVRADLDPDLVLPPALMRQHATSWRSDVREVTGDIVESIVLGSDDRRVFISYSHRDGADIAERLATILNGLRFDVFLDRFRLAPGVDFVERIADELVDKAMVVVVETPQAVRSQWVRQVIAFAASRRLGLAALHLAPGPTINGIDDLARCRIDDDDAIAAFVLDQHRTQLRQRREALLDSVWRSLLRAGVGPDWIATQAEGFRVETPGPIYSMTVCPRPADLRRFRLSHERAASAADPVLVHPRPLGADRLRDLTWLIAHTGMVDVDEGLIDMAAGRIAAGAL